MVFWKPGCQCGCTWWDMIKNWHRRFLSEKEWHYYTPFYSSKPTARPLTKSEEMLWKF